MSYKAIQLGNRGLVTRMTDVPHLHAAFAPGIDMTSWVTDGDSTYHLSVAESIDLSCMAWDAGAD